jgi:hypothetical protein
MFKTREMKKVIIAEAEMYPSTAYVPAGTLKFVGEGRAMMLCSTVFDDLEAVYGSNTEKWKGRELWVAGWGKSGNLKFTTCDQP